MRLLLPIAALALLPACEPGVEPGQTYVHAQTGDSLGVLRVGQAADLYAEHSAEDGTTRQGRGLAATLATQRTVLRADSSERAFSYAVETSSDPFRGTTTEVRILPLDSLEAYALIEADS